jgi:GrpB-like predicted nucleotidyltransferase (UPF0157 family)
MARIIEIQAFNPDWPRIFHEEAQNTKAELGPNLLSAYHIESTAVPGLAAKPIIDILLVVRALDALDACNDTMLRLGYIAKGENGISGRRYFQHLEGDLHLVHIHTFESGHLEIARHLNFRDYLIAHPQTAQDYQDLKYTLAAQFREAPADYTAGKGDFIHMVDECAAAWREESGPHHRKDR